MEGIPDVIRLEDWPVSIDLKDAFFHIPILKTHCKFLRFFWRGKLYQFLVLPFGLCTAPFIFTKITKPVAAFLRLKGIRIADLNKIFFLR